MSERNLPFGPPFPQGCCGNLSYANYQVKDGCISWWDWRVDYIVKGEPIMAGIDDAVNEQKEHIMATANDTADATRDLICAMCDICGQSYFEERGHYVSDCLLNDDHVCPACSWPKYWEGE